MWGEVFFCGSNAGFRVPLGSAGCRLWERASGIAGQMRVCWNSANIGSLNFSPLTSVSFSARTWSSCC